MAVAAIGRLGELTESVCAALRLRFARGEFTPQLVADAEGYVPGVLLPPRLPLLRWWLQRRGEPGAALARLFMYHDSLSAAEAGATLGGELLASLTHAGVVIAEANGGFVSPFLFTPLTDELWLLSDPLSADGDAVMGPGGGTSYLGGLVPHPFTGAVLDLGCGAGSLALIAARHGATRVLGIDINPRAVEIARFNARFNALEAHFLVGDAADAQIHLLVAGNGGFDLVLSQPPYVVQPAEQPRLTYLYGGTTGDELPQRFIAAMAGILAPAGRGMALLQSAERANEPLAVRLRAALSSLTAATALAPRSPLAGGAGSSTPPEPTSPAALAPPPWVDILVLGSRAPPPATQASVFASFEDPTLGQRYAAVARRYLDHFAALDMREFVGALVVLTRPAAAAPFAATAAHPHPPAGGYTLGLRLANPGYDSASLEQFLHGLELLSWPADHFEQVRLRLSAFARLEPQPSSEGDVTHPRAILRVTAPGIGTDWPLEAEQLQALAEIDRADTLRAALAATAAARGVAPLALLQEFFTLARDALVRGALVRAPPH